MTPPALPGEAWRGVLDGRDVAIVLRLVLRAVEWRAGEWHRMWDEDAAAVFRAWGETMAAERDAARGVAQLSVEERDAMHMRAERAEATIAEAWATMPPERVRLLGGMGVTLAEVVTDAREWREHEEARADAAEAERDALRRQLGRAQDELDAYRDERRGRTTP